MAEAGDPEGALRVIAAASNPADAGEVACNAIGYVCISANRYREAVRWFDRALARTAPSAQALTGKGLALQCLGRAADAVRCYDLALSIRPYDPDTLYNRGVALQSLGQLDAALASYDVALAQRPQYLFAMQKRCVALEMCGRLPEALAGLDGVLAIAPDCPDAWCRRGNVLQKLRRWDNAVACYDTALRLRPEFPAALVNRAAALKELHRLPAALCDVSGALLLEPNEPEALMLRGNILQALERVHEAERDFRRSVGLRPLIRHPAIQSPAEFTALFIFSPQAGNTPYEDLISHSAYDSNVLVLLSGAKYDVRSLRRQSDVVVNLVSDVDSSGERLLQARDLLEAIGKPVVNHPSKVLLTDREQVSRTLAGIAHCCVPQTLRKAGPAILEMLSTDTWSHPFPLVARVAGTHGGNRMERIDSGEQLAEFVGPSPEAEFYVAGYVDSRSTDGLFRKYRFMYVGEEILPYHLAIGERWKVHHASTSMADHAWMQAEEERFLDDPHATFDARSYESLRAIQKAIGLDYFGIDCAIDRQSRIVVFEANASMLVHLRNEQFPYKDRAVARIKSAFGSMLRQKIEAATGA
jgi:Flp pilus assembly protein TadD/glutathione synthase/RimK-type ligase-like ATP-grasp enzyme